MVTLQVADNVRLRYSKAAIQELLDRKEEEGGKGKQEAKETKELPEGQELEESA